MSAGNPDLTTLLVRMRHGDSDAANRAMETLYDELRKMAAVRMRGEAGHHTLRPTALVHEAYMRLMHGSEIVNDRNHFFALAAQAMRRVLVDHARHKRSLKRGGEFEHVTLDGAMIGEEAFDIDVLALEDALTELAALDPHASRIVELKFYGGYTDNEVCDIVEDNFAAVRRSWVFARSWLKTRLETGARA
jgi:RNA polymerase sigma-70 factor (ECF subfamily)